MSNIQIQQMNDIIAEWKRACVYNLSDTFIDEHLNKEELASKPWADIIRTTYKLVSNRNADKFDMRRNNVHRTDAMITNLLIVGATNGLHGFDWRPEVFEFYRSALGPAREVALSLMKDEATVGDGEPYAILPAGTAWNAGNSVGLQNITPRAVEIIAVSDNPDAHKVNDILICRPTYAAIIRAVPELPKPMLAWAAKNNIKVH